MSPRRGGFACLDVMLRARGAYGVRYLWIWLRFFCGPVGSPAPERASSMPPSWSSSRSPFYQRGGVRRPRRGGMHRGRHATAHLAAENASMCGQRVRYAGLVPVERCHSIACDTIRVPIHSRRRIEVARESTGLTKSERGDRVRGQYQPMI